jgi:hypothetical protein
MGLIGLTGCSSSISSSSPRFTHVDVEGPLPFVFFDQDTRQVCWGMGDGAKGSKMTVTVKAKPTGDAFEISMPYCKDLK